MAIVRLKAGDNETFTSTLKSGGVAVNLTGSTVRFLLRLVDSPNTAYSYSATIVNAAAGTVRYTSDSNFTRVTGKYRQEWEVTTSGGSVSTYLNSDYHYIVILHAIGVADPDDPWILADGVWDDNGQWDDSALWIDAA